MASAICEQKEALATIRFTRGNSSVFKDLRFAPISYQLQTTELNKKLFCYPGTDIYMHDFVPHVKAPSKEPDRRVLPFDLRYGAAEASEKDGAWFFYGDFNHCEKDNVKHSLRIMRSMLEKFRVQFEQYKPYALHKDYDAGLYLYAALHVPEDIKIEGIKHFCQRERQFGAKDLKPWDQLEAFEPPPIAWIVEQERAANVVHDNCPLCANRPYLESLGELKPEVTGDEEIDYHLAMNFNYYKDSAVWSLNWLLLKHKFELDNSPKCKQCNKPILTHCIFGCDSWVNRVKTGLCDEHDPAEIRIHSQIQAEMSRSKGAKPGLPFNKEQSSLLEFGINKK